MKMKKSLKSTTAILDAYYGGLKTYEVAKKFGIPVEDVLAVLKKTMGGESKELVVSILDAYHCKGLRTHEVAKMLNIPVKTVMFWLEMEANNHLDF